MNKYYKSLLVKYLKLKIFYNLLLKNIILGYFFKILNFIKIIIIFI